jgi:hypothetical protein
VTISNGTTTASGVSSTSAVAARAANVATPIRRSGTIRVPSRSDQRPTPTRSTIAKACATANAPAAAVGENPRSSCRKRTAKLKRTICAVT